MLHTLINLNQLILFEPVCAQTLSKFSNNYPVAIVYPASTEQVQAAVKCAKAAKVKVLPRCGNHGNEGEPGASLDRSCGGWGDFVEVLHVPRDCCGEVSSRAGKVTRRGTHAGGSA
jgi:hypothetical protein